MTEPLKPLLTFTGDTDAELCGPDGCMIPPNHPAVDAPTTTEEAKDHSMTRIAIITGSTC